MVFDPQTTFCRDYEQTNDHWIFYLVQLGICLPKCKYNLREPKVVVSEIQNQCQIVMLYLQGGIPCVSISTWMEPQFDMV